MDAPRKSLLGPGEAAPWFRAPALGGSPTYAFDTAGGRMVLMLFFGSAAEPACAEALAKVVAVRALFDDLQASFFGISVDPRDAAEGRIRQQLPGLRFFLDYQRQLSASYGALAEDGGYRPH